MSQQQYRHGMTVYTTDGRNLGTVERVEGTGIVVNGRAIPQSAIGRVAKGGIYLTRAFDAGAWQTGTLATTATANEIRVPVAEERLQVGKREVEQGAVEIRKTVTEERQTVPVTLRQEEVRVEERDIADRPLRAGEDAFQEGTIRVAVRGEEAVVAKEAVVTGEVVINKEQTERQEQVSGTVRREQVDVDRQYQQLRSQFEQDFALRGPQPGRTFDQAEPNYRAGFAAAGDARYQGRRFEEIEPELRREHESRLGAGRGDSWEHLREEIRTGYESTQGHIA